MTPTIDDAKCILITGATSGIGRALALDIVKLPSKPQVIASGRRKDRLEELAKAGLHPLELDLGSDLDTLKKAVDGLIAEYPNVRLRSRRSPSAYGLTIRMLNSWIPSS